MGGSQKSSLQIPSAFQKLDDATHNEDVNYERMRAAAAARRGVARQCERKNDERIGIWHDQLSFGYVGF